ncbi:hypothetical protein EDEG_02066 [Edhazardia aedis USNM 41457]|uniref:Uncharacterized protein n=1 Tax=Edhazardia aedis (strain USNM 41457) TaxID=1003232 RepID=J8ZVD8_EDHAE|nr:hypothetical protein EDEG_02066 [Edhazardia aedis USNM 41457]|eukprot:EJW03598.1 hypothetical protein EDEG_02066 [Edhazardia aedis USNM 41457]
MYKGNTQKIFFIFYLSFRKKSILTIYLYFIYITKRHNCLNINLFIYIILYLIRKIIQFLTNKFLLIKYHTNLYTIIINIITIFLLKKNFNYLIIYAVIVEYRYINKRVEFDCSCLID